MNVIIFMNISTELCISRIPGCESCSVSGNSVTCVECQIGLINDGNECKRKCLYYQRVLYSSPL